MTELGLILSLNVAGLVLVASLMRWLLGSEPETAEVRRLDAALQRATNAFIRREYRLAVIGAGVLGLSLFAIHGYVAKASGPPSLSSGFWVLMGVLLGALGATWVGSWSAHTSLRASMRVGAAAHNSLDSALSVAFRTGGAIGLGAEALAALGVTAFFFLLYSMKGGFADPSVAHEAASATARLLPGFAVGAAVVGLFIQRAGGIYHSAGDAGGDLAAERGAGLGHDDSRNPAVVADLVGDHVGVGASRAVDLFVSSAVAHVASILVTTHIAGQNLQHFGNPLTVVLLPALVRAFGLLASSFGIMVVRVTDATSPVWALWRGQLTASVIALAGLAGVTSWLFGNELWLELWLVGAVGLIASGAASHLAGLRSDRRFVAIRSILDALRSGESALVLQGLALGLRSVLAPGLLLGGAAAFAWHLGARWGIASGELLSVTIALGALLSTAPYLLGVGSFAAIVDNSRGIASMTPGSTSPDAARRTAQLDDAGFTAACVAQPYLIYAGTWGALVAATIVPLLNSGVQLDITVPLITWCGVLGTVTVLTYTGSTLAAATRGSRIVGAEVERQLRGFPFERGVRKVPGDFTPSYRACIDLSTRAALDRIAPPVLLAAMSPLFLGLALHWIYGARPGLVAAGLAAFVTLATLTGFALALAGDGARAVLSATRRFTPAGSRTSFNVSLVGDAVADVIGNCAAPSAQVLVKSTAIVAVAVATVIFP